MLKAIARILFPSKELVEAADEEEEVKVQDDDRELFVIKKEEFVLDRRYRPLKKLGKGAYGMVISAKDMDHDCKVAIKKNVDVFQSRTCAKRILREIKLLNHFDHPNIIGIRDVVNPRTVEEYDDIYLVLDYMQSDLHRIISSENKLSDSHVGCIIYQILCALKYMHSAGVYHRDLKPSNILVNSQCEAKICDFGLARGVEDPEEMLTEYVVTRWYRAPEVILNARRYGAELDVWSVGCILAELYYRRPVFRGDDYKDQLKRIFRVIGRPSVEDVSDCVDDDSGIRFLDSLQIERTRTWKQLLPNAPDDALDLIEKLLTFHPEKRISVDDALQHPFLARFYDDEFVNSRCVCEEAIDMDFENHMRHKKDIRDMMTEEIQSFRPETQFVKTPKAVSVKTKRFQIFQR